jgi:hypothetical protein
VALVALLLVAACGDGGPPEAQPAPGVSTFEVGRFEDLPLHPRSDPVGTRSETDGVTTQSFVTDGVTTRDVLEFYERVLPERGWVPIGQIERTGPDAHRGDWQQDGWSLQVSASDAAALDTGGQVADEVTTQYSLILTEP